MRPKRIVFEAPAQAQLDKWARDDNERSLRLQRIVIHKLTIDGDADAATGPRFGRVRSLLSTPTIGDNQYLRILWEPIGDEARVWALAVVDEFDLDDEDPPEE